MMIKKAIQSIARTWFTGFIYLLAFAGYVFYGILWLIRFVQTMKKTALIIVVMALFCAVFLYYALLPTHSQGAAVDLRISHHASLWSVARELQKRKVISWAPALVALMKYTGGERHFQAGHFVFIEYEGALSAASRLLHAQAVEIPVTIPEGLTMEQAAGLFFIALKIDTATFDSLCRAGDFIKRLGIDAPSLEGYLFPDTYRFPENAGVSEIIKRMVEHFNESMRELQGSDSSGQMPLSSRQTLILASIIEKEAAVESERPRISAVFHNRLKMGIPLGADPTVRYIFRKFSGPLKVSELRSQSPYNTRVFAGLPPGPICSPGLASLSAAMHPERTKELYFVAKWDGSGAHDFSLTNEEHCRKKQAIQRLNERRIKKKNHADN